MPSQNRIFGLDVMRATAIILVVTSHTGWLLPNKSGLLFELLSVAGLIGVEIFFVLSGFLIGRIIYRFFTSEDFDSKDVQYFWIRRWFRTLPNYFLALILNVVVIISIGSSLPDGVWKYPFFLQNFAWKMPPFFYESWSLSIEEFAYILGPLLIFLMFRFNKNGNRSRQYLYMVLSIIFFSTFARMIYNHFDEIKEMRHWNLSLKAVVIYRLDAIYYGALAAYFSIKKPNFWRKYSVILFLFGLGIFILLNLLPVAKGILINTHRAFWNIWYLMLISLSVCLCLPLLSRWNAQPNFIVKLITTISLISYAMYVLHYSIIMQVMRHQIPNEALNGIDIIIYIIVYWSIVLLSSYLVFKFFERPLTNLRDHKFILKKFSE